MHAEINIRYEINIGIDSRGTGKNRYRLVDKQHTHEEAKKIIRKSV